MNQGCVRNNAKTCLSDNDVKVTNPNYADWNLVPLEKAIAF